MTEATSNPSETPDAHLLALDAELTTLNRRQDALWQQEMRAKTKAERDAAHKAASVGTERYHAILDELQVTPAQTREGERVKAQAIMRWLSPEGGGPENHDGRVAWSLAQDVLRSTGDSPDVTLSVLDEACRGLIDRIPSDVGSASDAELIAICDEIVDLNAKTEALDDVDEANFARWMELTARAATMPAETVDGLRARLRSIGKNLLADNMVGSSGGVARSHFEMAAQDLWRFATGSMGAPAVSPDAELIAACSELEHIELDYLRIFHGSAAIEEGKEQDAALDAYKNNERRHELEAFISGTRARTVEGMRAKARAIATEDLDLTKSEEQPLASLLRDLVGDYDPIAAAKGQHSKRTPKVAGFVETPILELGRRTAAAERRMEDYDFPEGELYKTVSPDYAALMNGAACDEIWSLTGIICDLPALTMQDVVVQLHAAFVLSDQLLEGQKKGAPSARIRKVLASALRVLMARPGAVAPGTIDLTGKGAFSLVWKGEMPAVHLT